MSSTASRSSSGISTSRESDIRRQSRTIAQNYLVIWLDSTIIHGSDMFQKTRKQLLKIVSFIEIYVDVQECTAFITSIHDQKILLVVSDKDARNFIPIIHQNPHVDTIYIFNKEQDSCNDWLKSWSKIKGVYNRISSIHTVLKPDINRCEHDCESISIMPSSDDEEVAFEKLDKSFIYTQLLKEVLLDKRYDDSAMRELIDFCSHIHQDSSDELQKIKKFGEEYDRNSAIWWYTEEGFTYRMLNRALRTQDVETLIKMGFFLRDVHQQIHHMHSTYSNTEPFTVFRGQSMLQSDFEKLKENPHGLLSFNNFLSTSKDTSVAYEFANLAQGKCGMIGVLFQMYINPSITTVPFADLGSVSRFGSIEKEILFSMHTIFQIGEIKNIRGDLWQVDLKIVADDDQHLRCLIERIQFEIRGATPNHRLGNLLIHLKLFDHAEECYRQLLKTTSAFDVQALIDINHQMASILRHQSKYKEACEFYCKNLEIQEKLLPANHPHLMNLCHDIALVYEQLKHYQLALSFFQRAIDIARRNNISENETRFKLWENKVKAMHAKLSERLEQL